MLYEYAKQIIAMFFLIAIVNLLVIPASYKKIITFYLHFFIIVIILKPVISIMNNEVTSLIDSVSFLDEGKFDESIQYYQGLVETDLSKITLAEMEARVKSAGEACEVQLLGFEFDEELTIEMAKTDTSAKTCMLKQLNLNQEDVIFKGGD